MFEALEMAPPDPILGLTEAFKKDPNPDKANLGVGVYQDDSGRTPIFAVVKKAERRMLEAEASKSYLPMSGAPEFATAVQSLLFGADSPIVASGRAQTCQAPGGTGALRLAGDFLKNNLPGARLWVSDPTWSNHLGVFGAAGLEISSYPYYDHGAKRLDFARMMDALAAVPEGDVVLLHGCCHNPSGMDPTMVEWEKIAAMVTERRLLPLIDIAYQGLADGLDEDAAATRLLSGPGREALICSSFSKNMGLYCERVGALTVVAATAKAAEPAFSHVKIAARQNYSNPPYHGAGVVATVVNDPALRAEWEGEVAVMRERIHAMRRRFVDTLQAKGVTQDFSFITRQNGMFSFSGLTKEQVETLRQKHALYIVSNGRINVAGLTPGNLDRICEAIAGVL